MRVTSLSRKKAGRAFDEVGLDRDRGNIHGRLLAEQGRKDELENGWSQLNRA